MGKIKKLSGPLFWRLCNSFHRIEMEEKGHCNRLAPEQLLTRGIHMFTDRNVLRDDQHVIFHVPRVKVYLDDVIAWI